MFKIQLLLLFACTLLPSTFSLFDFETFLKSFESKCGSEFQCTEGTCISKKLVCDGKADCSDKSDEANCGTTLKACRDLNSFQCHDEKCISNSSVCNGVQDCSGGEDEKNCKHVVRLPKCFGKFFECSNGMCIPSKWVCDGKIDCPDGGDETSGCSKKMKCDDDEFKCKNHLCIPKVFQCDGTKDCDDNSDEENCGFKTIDLTNCKTSNGKFACNDNLKCIDIQLTCNKKRDCLDGSDENEKFCDSKEVCKNCTHLCVHTYTGPICVCKEGFMLEPQNNSCIDLNECQLFGSCDQKCNNAMGSYTCSCNSPYVLDSDGHTCKIKNGDAVLLYSATDQICEFFINSNTTSTIVDQLSHTVGVASGGRYVYWTVVGDHNRAIMRAESGGSPPEAIVTTGIDQPEGLAVDWITLNIYFTDAGKKSIGVCSNDGYTCIILHNEDIDKPRGIALSPMHGLMFWTDWGKRPLIAQSGMDGSNVIVFVGGNIHWPNGITVDEPAERIYWIEAKLQRIETIKFDGTDRRIILGNIGMHPFSIAIFENQIYWSDVSGNEILACNKFTGRGRRSIVREPIKGIYDLHLHHHLLQQRQNIANPCIWAPCTDLCLLKPSPLNYTCACPEGQILAKNNYQCIVQDPPHVLFAALQNHVYVIEYRTLGRQRIHDFELSLGEVTTIAYDSLRDAIVLFDSMTRSMYSYSLHKKTLSFLYSSGLGMINSLHYDEIGDNLYWCDWFSLNIEALNLKTLSRMVIVSRNTVETTYDLALAPELDYLFVSLIIAYQRVEIYRFSMSGSIVSKTLLAEVNSGVLDVKLHYSRELQRLFFTNGVQGTVESIDVNGQNRHVFLENQAPTAFTSSNGILFWTEKSSPYIFSKSPNNSVVKQDIKMDKFVYGGFISLTPLVKRNVSQSPCATNNGGCSHLCLVSHQSKLKKICACPSGLALAVDDKTCIQPRSCSAATEHQCLTGECISLRKVCDGHEDCVHGDDEYKNVCGYELSCPAEQFLCSDKKKCVDNYRRCDGKFDCADNSDEVCNSTCTKMHDKYWCISGECIDINFRCDNKVDCKYGHDEFNCHLANCSANEFRCLSGQCIPIEWECDSEPDCVDGSDESSKCRGSACFKEEFMCDNKRCVDARLVCNGIDDCGDHSDEAACRDKYINVGEGTNKICNPHYEFYCPFNDRPCLPLAARCNGTRECHDGSDEQNCTLNPCFKGAEFYCSNSKKCIPTQWLCDAYNDCGDNSDEVESVCLFKTLPDKNCTGFQCKSGECVSLLKICDNIPDCPDRSDEGNQCNVSCQKLGCQHNCLQTPHGPQCSCPNGFSLDLKTNKTCLDVNECDLNMCSQECQNTNGSFKCSCYSPHYILRSDHVSCKARGDSMIFVAASDITVDIFSNNVRHKTELNLGTNLFKTIRGIDVDSFNKSVFILLEDGELWKIQFIQGGISERMRIQDVTSFAHDWITQNIYYIEEHVAIKVTAWNSTNSIQIHHTNGTKYMWALAVDTYAGYIFWFESDVNMDNISGRIRRADATGANPKTIVKDLDYGVRQLVVDSFGKHVYWINRIEHSIHRTNYDGTHGMTMKNFEDDAIAFTFFENSVYLVTRHFDKFGVKRCKIYGLPPRKCETVKMSLSYIHYLSIMQENRQKTIPNPCYDAVCSGYCVTSPTDLMCKHFDGSLSPIVKESLQWQQEDGRVTFGTFLAYFIFIGFAIAVGVALYVYRYKSKSSFLRSFHFHNRISIRADTTYTEHSSILNADTSFENPLIEVRPLVDCCHRRNTLSYQMCDCLKSRVYFQKCSKKKQVALNLESAPVM